jgi:UPF0755 protein
MAVKRKSSKLHKTANKPTSFIFKKAYYFYILGFVLLSLLYFIFFASNINSFTSYFYFTAHNIRNREDLIDQLEKQNIIKNSYTLSLVSKFIFDGQLKNGMYKISNQWGNVAIFYHLKNDDCIQYKSIKIESYRKRSLTIRKLCDAIDIDQKAFYSTLNSHSFSKDFEISKEEFFALLLPIKQNFPIKSNPDEAINILKSNFYTYFDDQKLEALKYSGLNPIEASILSSIVYAETKNTAEMPIIAGVYINRLQKKMKLESDPTVVFALGNKNISRVYKKHTLTPSDYNTYLHKGLTPGPIGSLNLKALESVIFFTQHDYLFFCANPLHNGTHLFSENFQEHLKIAQKYRKSLKQKKEGL